MHLKKVSLSLSSLFATSLLTLISPLFHHFPSENPTKTLFPFPDFLYLCIRFIIFIMNVTLKNDLLSVVISSHGAELQNITNIRTGQEYLWQGDAAFWGRRSPVLFPIVGAV